MEGKDRDGPRGRAENIGWAAVQMRRGFVFVPLACMSINETPKKKHVFLAPKCTVSVAPKL